MARFNPHRFDIILADLPMQSLTQRDNNGRPFTTVGTEMHGDHRCVVIAVQEDGRGLVVIPMSSAQNSAGGEKWGVVTNTWLRINHKGKPAYIHCEQIRYIAQERIFKPEGSLGEYERRELEARLRMLLVMP